MGKDYREYDKLSMKPLVRIQQNNEVFLKTEVCGDVIAIYYYYYYYYYYYDNESFDVGKGIIF